MIPGLSEEVLKETIAALSRSGDDALTKACAEGLPSRDEVVAWSERVQRLILTQRDRSVLRSEIPQLEVRKLQPLPTVGALGVGVLLGVGFFNLLSNPVAERGTGRDPSVDARVALPFGGR